MNIYVQDLVSISQCRLVAATNADMQQYVGRDGIRGDYQMSDGSYICFFTMENGQFFRTSPGDMECYDQGDQGLVSILVTDNSQYEWEDLKEVEPSGMIRDWVIDRTRRSSYVMAQMLESMPSASS